MFDIDNNNFWPREWGNKSEDREDMFNTVRNILHIPKLITDLLSQIIFLRNQTRLIIQSFQFIKPHIIIYGNDLPDYLRKEFKIKFPNHTTLSIAEAYKVLV